MRNYKRKAGARKYADYLADNLAEALPSCQEGMPYREASAAYGIPISTSNRKLNNLNSGTPGHPTALSHEEQSCIVDSLKCVAKWGFSMTKMDLRGLAKDYLDRKGIGHPDSTDNYAGDEWCLGFLNRNKGHLINDPGKKIVIAHVDRTKAAVSVMFFGSAIGNILPPYRLKICGPPGQQVVQKAPGSTDQKVVDLKLPLFSTGLTITRCIFSPLKQHWRKVLDNCKKANSKAPSIAKNAFPKLLKQLIQQIMIKGKANLVSGFKACGIYYRKSSTNFQKLNKRLSKIDQSVLSYLKNMRHDKQERKPRKKRSKLSIEPGKSMKVPESEKSEKNFESEEKEQQVQEENVERISTLSSLKVGDWIAAEYEKKWYLAVVEAEESFGCVLIKFLTPAGPALKFQWPQKEDKLLVPVDQIVAKLKEAALPLSRYFKISKAVIQ
ncbi:hypothetical protein ILUMI_27459 [Ignelater luminosus]|uniref:HTH psq-type domain-containing protein n=1 Tax=Ignelater luminosus TaxID=2038154 RepID=A0A8K0C6H2_IGNLU|nr:hypothetical protein ILUMI_27459 [Ignelater luminosus]